MLEIMETSPVKLSFSDFAEMVEIAIETQEHIVDNTFKSRQKDYQSNFRKMMYDNQEEMDAVIGAFEPIAELMISDIKNKVSGKIYDGRINLNTKDLQITNVKVMGNLNKYYQFMGVPVETSKGCDKKCTFCMVHQMQPAYESEELLKLKLELDNYQGRFINIIDYNIGVDIDHFMAVAKVFKESKVLGWMAESCLETLDNEQLLKALSESRCKMIYCGLESIEEDSLKSVNKAKTNQLQNYERIIHKVLSYGIQVAAGLILGIEGTKKSTFKTIKPRRSKNRKSIQPRRPRARQQNGLDSDQSCL